MGFEIPPMPELLAIGLTIFLAIGIHEFCHAKFAEMAGDPTPRRYGRVTLDLTKHFELMGTIMIVFTSLMGVGIGWGKPVPMDPRQMKNPKWDHFIAVAAGPASNLVQAGIFALVLRAGLSFSPVFADALAMRMDRFTSTEAIVQAYGFGLAFLVCFIFFAILINIALCIFNLIPIGPLDGMWLASTFMPPQMRVRYQMFNRTYGGMIFIGLILFSQMSGLGLIEKVIMPPLIIIFRFLTGI